MDDSLLCSMLDLMASNQKAGPHAQPIDFNNARIIKFTTLVGTSIYGMYNPHTTSIKSLVETFFDNYECKDVPRKNIFMYVPHIDRDLEDFSAHSLISVLGSNKIINIRLKVRPNAVESDIPKCSSIITPKCSSTPSSKDFDTVYEEAVEKFKEKKLSGQPMTIFIKTLTGKTVTVNTLSSSTILDIKREVFDKESIPPNQQRMIFAGGELENEKTIQSYRIQDCSTIHLVLRMRGGMFHETSGRAGDYAPLKSCIFMIPD